MEAKWKQTATDIRDDLGRFASEKNDLVVIARVFGVDLGGADMERITGLSAATLSRSARGLTQPRAWRHISTVAAVAREVLTLMESANGKRAVDADASRRWLYGGRVHLGGQAYRPIDALSDESLSVALLADLRHANAR